MFYQAWFLLIWFQFTFGVAKEVFYHEQEESFHRSLENIENNRFTRRQRNNLLLEAILQNNNRNQKNVPPLSPPLSPPDILQLPPSPPIDNPAAKIPEIVNNTTPLFDTLFLPNQKSVHFLPEPEHLINPAIIVEAKKSDNNAPSNLLLDLLQHQKEKQKPVTITIPEQFQYHLNKKDEFKPLQSDPLTLNRAINQQIPDEQNSLMPDRRSSTVSQYHGNIYITWHLSSDKLHYLNYKSLESILLIYPYSKIIIFIIAPISANYYKIGKILSKTTFQKYSKRGLLTNNIHFHVIHNQMKIVKSSYSMRMKSLLGNSKDNSGGGGGMMLLPSEIPGYADYWTKNIQRYCESKHINTLRDKVPAPYHLHIYYVLLQLYQYGGFFLDLSFIHRYPFLQDIETMNDVEEKVFNKKNRKNKKKKERREGREEEGEEDDDDLEYAAYYMKTVCLPDGMSMTSPNNNKNNNKDTSRKGGVGMKCETSTILAFSAHHLILSCILKNFNESVNPYFLRCLSLDRMSEGAFCIEHEINDCFRKYRYPNPLDQYYNDAVTLPLSPSPAPSNNDVRTSSYKMTERAIVKDYQRILRLTKNSCYYISKATTSAGDNNNNDNDNIITKLFNNPNEYNCSIYPMNYEQFLYQNYSNLYYNDGMTLSSPSSFSSLLVNNYSDYFHGKKAIFPLVWLGLSSFSGDWDLPNPDSFLYHIIRQNDALIQGKIRVDPTLHTLIQTNQSKTMEEVLTTLPTCHPYDFPLPPATSRTATSAMLYQRAQISCAPTFVIPGFMKAGTTYFYDTIVQHPMLVKALSGVQFKETGCYLDLISNNNNNNNNNLMMNNNNYKTVLLKKKLKLMNCYPFLTSSDYTYYGDATVYYSQREMIPYYLIEDNPNMKVLFSLRNPLQRTLSHHRFNYRFYRSHGIGNINQCLMKVLNDQVLQQWHQLARDVLSAPSEEEREILNKRLLASYLTGLGRKNDTVFSRCGHLVVYSLYYMPIYHWYTIFPKENIRLINIEYLHPKYISLDEKSRLLSLTPVIDQMNWTRLFDYTRVKTSEEATSSRKTISEEMKEERRLLDEKDDDINLHYMKYQLNAIYR